MPMDPRNAAMPKNKKAVVAFAFWHLASNGTLLLTRKLPFSSNAYPPFIISLNSVKLTSPQFPKPRRTAMAYGGRSAMLTRVTQDLYVRSHHKGTRMPRIHQG